ncbi:benzoate-CoA ligase family protein [Sporichthya polymorpha]|uniref:benzoate-CoA ligase family protein n=1 Tax=Sporichthya polymorpha TaxID=35751 RepID=UPI000373970F|nr:benzoate-CoA ligase family protein [Sporichthya polymorpha]
MVAAENFNAGVYLLDRQVEAGRGDHLAVTGPAGDVTYAELATLVQAAAAGLAELGLRPEERIVLFSADRVELLAMFLAGLRMGAVPVPVSTMYLDTELAELLHDSRARLLFTSPEFVDTARSALAKVPSVWTLIVTDDVPPVANPDERVTPPGGWCPQVTWSELVGVGQGQDSPVYDTWTESPAFWLYTSGTTGIPKAAMHRHGSVRYVAEHYGQQVLGITPEDRCFSVAKLFFAYGLGNSALFPLSVGATAVLDPVRPTPQSVATRIAEHRPTLFYGVPTFYAAVLAADLPADTFAGVRLATSAGEALPAELYHRFTSRFGVDILDGIGSTEALHIFLSNYPGQVRPGTTGRAVPGYDLRLVDDEGNVVPPGTPGNLQIRGGSLTTGYWCRTETTRNAFVGEWMRTGDTYVQDEEGNYVCLGRSNDMIKAGGIWVSPAEVEACLLQHPSVAQAAVVAVPDEAGLDKPVACVVAAPGHTIDPDALIEACRAELAAFKRPRAILEFATLPTTATGKLRRFAVRDEALIRLKPPAS